MDTGRKAGANFHIRVAIRTRPILASDYQRISTTNNPNGIAPAVHVIPENNSILMVDPATSKPTHQYFFDKVFLPEETTEDVYNITARQIVYHAVKGYNGTVFAYGQTSTGKTHTVFGHSEAYPGIVPMAINDIFEQIDALSRNRMFFVRLAALELYNERLTDLAVAEEDRQKTRPLRIRETQGGFIFVENLVEEVCTTRDSALNFLNECLTRRHMAQTLANDDSSRSHVICRIVIESRPIDGHGDMTANLDAVTVGELNFVDLAGSECAVRIVQPINHIAMHSIGSTLPTETSKRLKEGRAINRSLLMLGMVIGQLSEARANVNYRNSKLTRILQNALGGNSLTAIICTISPAEADKRQTISTLQFANNAKSIKTRPHLNETYSPDQAVLRRLQMEIERLRRRIVELETQQSFSSTVASTSSERQKLHENERILLGMIAGGRPSSRGWIEPDKPLLSRRMTWAPTGSGHAILMFTGDKDERSESTQPENKSDDSAMMAASKSIVFHGMLGKVSTSSDSRSDSQDSPNNRSTADKEPLATTIERIENEEEFRERFVGRQYFEVVAKNYEKLKQMLEVSLGTAITEDDNFSEVADRISHLVSQSSGQNSAVMSTTPSIPEDTESEPARPRTSLTVSFSGSTADRENSDQTIQQTTKAGSFRIIRRTAMSARLPPLVLESSYLRAKSASMTHDATASMNGGNNSKSSVNILNRISAVASWMRIPRPASPSSSSSSSTVKRPALDEPQQYESNGANLHQMPTENNGTLKNGSTVPSPNGFSSGST